MIRMRIPRLDDGAIFKLVMQELLPLVQLHKPWTQFSMPELKARLKHQTTFTVSASRGAAFGFVTVKSNQRVLNIDMLALDPKYHKRGYGKALMLAAEKYGVQKGCNRAVLSVDEPNRNAQGFYSALGYQVQQFAPDMNCYIMSKPLQQ